MPPRKKKRLTFAVISPTKGIQNAQAFARNLRAAPTWTQESATAPGTPGTGQPHISQLHAEAPELCTQDLAVLHQRLTQPEEWQEFIPESPTQVLSVPATPPPGSPPGSHPRSHPGSHPDSPPALERKHSEKHVGDSDGDLSYQCDHYS